jgi:hypothetical protein
MQNILGSATLNSNWCKEHIYYTISYSSAG